MNFAEQGLGTKHGILFGACIGASEQPALESFCFTRLRSQAVKIYYPSPVCWCMFAHM